MTAKNEKKYSLGIITIYTLLIASFVWVQLNVFGIFDREISSESESVNINQVKIEGRERVKPLKAAQGMFLVLKKKNNPPNFRDSSAKERTLAQFYQLRAYLGAPPSIPHSVKGKRNNVAGACNSCHEKGGFVPKYNAYTPITPHPEMENCTQCHTAKQQNNVFRQIAWVKQKKVRLKQSALVGAPPVIPHSIEMRENCQSCHTGPAAIREIRVSHPERVHCMQCHVVNKEKTIAQIPVKSIWTKKQ